MQFSKLISIEIGPVIEICPVVTTGQISMLIG